MKSSKNNYDYGATIAIPHKYSHPQPLDIITTPGKWSWNCSGCGQRVIANDYFDKPECECSEWSRVFDKIRGGFKDNLKISRVNDPLFDIGTKIGENCRKSIENIMNGVKNEQTK